MTWSGTFIESGKVTVWFQAYGREAYLTDTVGVAPRSNGIWTQAHWESKLTYDSAKASVNCLPARPVYGVRAGFTGSLSGGTSGCQGQQVEPITNGYHVQSIASGPNGGAWFVDNVGFYFASASQITPGARPGAPGAPLVDSAQAQDCRTALQLPPGPVSINFWDFNNACRPVAGWSGFIPALWAHERQHFEQAEAALQQPDNNIYLRLEDVVGSSEVSAYDQVYRIYTAIQGAASQAGSTEPTGNWTTNYWAWLSTTLNAFVKIVQPNF